MGVLINGQYVPGPNDHHVVTDESGKVVGLESGLGADEPDKAKLLKARQAGDAKIAAQVAALEARGIELTNTKKAIEAKAAAVEQEAASLAAREAALAEKEARIAEAEKKALAELEAAEAAAKEAREAAAAAKAAGGKK